MGENKKRVYHRKEGNRGLGSNRMPRRRQRKPCPQHNGIQLDSISREPRQKKRNSIEHSKLCRAMETRNKRFHFFPTIHKFPRTSQQARHPSQQHWERIHP